MKNLDLNYMGVQEMNTLEMQETDGGLVCLLIAGGILLLAASCINGPVTIQIGQTNNNTSGGGTATADSCRLDIPINVPIGY